MKKNSINDILRYRFDNLMSRGTIALVGILFIVTTLVIIIAGAIAALVGSGTMGENIWISIMHTIDAGTISGTETTDTPFVILMCIVTLCGLFVTSILIGIITTGFEERFSALKKGNSSVLEKGHTLILGFNDGIYTFITELITANQNQKDACIVILTPDDKEEIEAAISQMIPQRNGTRIICRTGNITDTVMLNKCAVTAAKSIIINSQDDFTIIKSILAINTIFNDTSFIGSKPHIVATINDELNLEAAIIAGEGNAELLLINDIIARIIAQTCRQSGLSNVLIELFDFDGDELYLESFPDAIGSSFSSIALRLEKSVAIGIIRDGKVMLNPDRDEVITANDQFILLAEDDGVSKLSPPRSEPIEIKSYLPNESYPKKPVDNLLILGVNSMLLQILQELNNSFTKGSTIIVADKEIPQEYISIASKFSNIKVEMNSCDTNDRKNLNYLVNDKINQVLLLSNDDCQQEDSDAATLLKLIHLRDIARKSNRVINITSEIKNSTNQKLAKVAQVNDLVVGTNIVNLALTQISENRKLSEIFGELLHSDGSEIYMRPALGYLTLGEPIDFYTITEIASLKGEVAIGYKKQEGIEQFISLNPNKGEKISFTKDDYIVVIAND